MIISASRRTDVPAFYAEWFIKRIRTGFCEVTNPFNAKQVSRVSLLPEAVDVIVFWTRHARPLMPYLGELSERGLRYYFQYTVTGYPRALERHTPGLAAAISTFRELAGRIGPDKVIWRYDPIVLSTITDERFHRAQFNQIAAALQGHTHRCVVSFVDYYRKSATRLRTLEQSGIDFEDANAQPVSKFAELLRALVDTAGSHGMEITSCAEELDLEPFGIARGKCIDDRYIQKLFGLEVLLKKDPSQRPACGCVISKDVGQYNTCPFGCQYCYANTGDARARSNHARHSPEATALG